MLALMEIALNFIVHCYSDNKDSIPFYLLSVAFNNNHLDLPRLV